MPWPIEFGNENPAPSLDWPLKTSLFHNVGSNAPTFSRASVGSVVDWENNNRYTIANESRFIGVNRIENMLPIASNVGFDQLNSSSPLPTNGVALSGCPGGFPTGFRYADNTTGVSTRNITIPLDNSRYEWSCIIYNPYPGSDKRFIEDNIGLNAVDMAGYNGTFNLYLQTSNITNDASEDLGNNYYRIWISFQNNSTVSAFTVRFKPQYSHMWGLIFTGHQLVRYPSPGPVTKYRSDFVSKGILTAPYHGANVDAVKYFADKPQSILRMNMWGDSLVQSYWITYFQLKYGLCSSQGVGGETSSQARVRFLAGTTHATDLIIIQCGSNVPDLAQTMSDLADMVALIPHNRFVICSNHISNIAGHEIGSASHNQFLAINAAKQAAYPNNYISTWDVLYNAYDPNNSTEATVHANGLIATGRLQADSIHPTELGGTMIAKAIWQFIVDKGMIQNQPIEESTKKGYLSEQQRVNYFLNSRAPVTQTIDLTAAGTGDYTLRVKGAGNVTCAANSATGTGFGVASAGTDITFNLSVAGTVEFTCAAIAAGDTVQVEKGSFASSFIETAAAAVPRDKDVLSRPTADELPANDFVIALEWTPQNVAMGTIFIWGTYVDADNGTYLLHDGTNIIFRKRISGTDHEVTKALTYAADTTYKPVIKQSSTTGMSMWVDGAKALDLAELTDAQIGETMQIGADGNSANQDFSCHKNFIVYNKPLTETRLNQLL